MTKYILLFYNLHSFDVKGSKKNCYNTDVEVKYKIKMSMRLRSLLFPRSPHLRYYSDFQFAFVAREGCLLPTLN